MYEKMLRVALDAALEAGELLRREFHKFGGPRGYGEHADADEEAEWMIRKRLLEAFPEHSYRGEEHANESRSRPSHQHCRPRWNGVWPRHGGPRRGR